MRTIGWVKARGRAPVVATAVRAATHRRPSDTNMVGRVAPARGTTLSARQAT
jgi:hypothetical protein